MMHESKIKKESEATAIKTKDEEEEPFGQEA